MAGEIEKHLRGEHPQRTRGGVDSQSGETFTAPGEERRKLRRGRSGGIYLFPFVQEAKGFTCTSTENSRLN